MKNSPSQEKLSYIIFIISIFSWCFFIINAKLNIGPFGLYDSMNGYFFLSIYLLIFSILTLLKYNSRSQFFIVQIFYLFLILYFSPYLLEKTASFTYSYLTYGYMDYITRTGHLNAALLPYQNWPGIMILGNVLTLTTNLDRNVFLIFYSLSIKIISLMFVYLIYLALAEDNITARLGLLIFLIGDWTAHQYFTPPSLAITIYFTILSIIFLLAFRNKKYTPAYSIIIIILASAIITSHLLSSVATISFLLIILIFTKINKLLDLGNFVLLSCILLLAWNIIQVGGYFTSNMARAFERFLDINSVVEATEQSSLGMGLMHTEIMYIKIFYLAIFSILAAIGILLSIVDEKKRKSSSTIILLGLLFVNTIITPLIVGPYSGEILSRVFGYDAIILAFFIARNWNVQIYNLLILLFLLMAPFLFVISSYGNESLDYVSPNEIAGLDFYYSKSSNNERVHVLSQRIWSSRQIEEHRWTPLIIKNINNTSLFSQENGGYVVLDDRSVEGYSFLIGDSKEKLIGLHLSNYFDHIYSSGGLKLFIGPKGF
jgi:hypothetical protein